MTMMRRTGSGLLFIARGAVLSVFRNLGLAALSLALALSLWLFVTDKENPTEAQTFNSSIPIDMVNVPEGLAVANANATGVRIRIEAPKNELDNLRADDFEATVNLGGLTAGTQSVPIDVTPPNSRINVTSIEPARVDVTLETLRRKDVPVKVQSVGSPVTGFSIAPGGERASPEQATVSGPESLVGLVDHVTAVVNISGQRVDITEDRVRLEPRDARDGGISRVTVIPDTARVTVDLVQTDYSIPLRVNPVITGQPAAGYEVVSNPRADPAFVTVTGKLEALQGLTGGGVNTVEISIADARDDILRDVQLNLPPGVVVEGSPTVTVTVDISPAHGERSFQVVPQLRNLAGELKAEPVGAVTVVLSGDVPTINGLTPQSVGLSVDLQGLGPGLYSVPIQISAPPGTSVVRIDPAELGVALTLR